MRSNFDMSGFNYSPMNKSVNENKQRPRHNSKSLLPEIFLKNLNETSYEDSNEQVISINDISKKEPNFVSNSHRNLAQNRVVDLTPNNQTNNRDNNDSRNIQEYAILNNDHLQNSRQTPRKRNIATFKPPKASFYDTGNISTLPDDSYINSPSKNTKKSQTPAHLTKFHSPNLNKTFHTPLHFNLNNPYYENDSSIGNDDFFQTPRRSNISSNFYKSTTPRENFNRSFIGDDARFDNSNEWVTVFGFNVRNDYESVYNYMQQFGNIIECIRSKECNYMHIRYFDASQAKKVLKKGHLKVSENLIIGVTLCTDKTVPQAVVTKSSNKSGILSKLYSFIGCDDE